MTVRGFHRDYIKPLCLGGIAWALNGFVREMGWSEYGVFVGAVFGACALWLLDQPQVIEPGSPRKP